MITPFFINVSRHSKTAQHVRTPPKRFPVLQTFFCKQISLAPSPNGFYNPRVGRQLQYITQTITINEALPKICRATFPPVCPESDWLKAWTSREKAESLQQNQLSHGPWVKKKKNFWKNALVHLSFCWEGFLMFGTLFWPTNNYVMRDLVRTSSLQTFFETKYSGEIPQASAQWQYLPSQTLGRYGLSACLPSPRMRPKLQGHRATRVLLFQKALRVKAATTRTRTATQE